MWLTFYEIIQEIVNHKQGEKFSGWIFFEVEDFIHKIWLIWFCRQKDAKEYKKGAWSWPNFWFPRWIGWDKNTKVTFMS